MTPFYHPRPPVRAPFRGAARPPGTRDPRGARLVPRAPGVPVRSATCLQRHRPSQRGHRLPDVALRGGPHDGAPLPRGDHAVVHQLTGDLTHVPHEATVVGPRLVVADEAVARAPVPAGVGGPPAGDTP